MNLGSAAGLLCTARLRWNKRSEAVVYDSPLLEITMSGLSNAQRLLHTTRISSLLHLTSCIATKHAAGNATASGCPPLLCQKRFVASMGQDAWRNDDLAQGISNMLASWHSCQLLRSVAFVSSSHRESKQILASPSVLCV